MSLSPLIGKYLVVITIRLFIPSAAVWHFTLLFASVSELELFGVRRMKGGFRKSERSLGRKALSQGSELLKRKSSLKAAYNAV